MHAGREKLARPELRGTDGHSETADEPHGSVFDACLKSFPPSDLLPCKFPDQSLGENTGPVEPGKLKDERSCHLVAVYRRRTR
ncbi:hypothetical protein [Rhizobium vallis]|uniref:hypothetical protein n=1 Tax=Rhizobium vallis TaxID=634290 RepID=UPI000F865073|nr:hypothetical protein [Rhizobium vallis]